MPGPTVVAGMKAEMNAEIDKRRQEIEAELDERRRKLEEAGGYAYPESQTPWQELQRGCVDQLSEGMVLKPAVKYKKIARTFIPRHSH